MKKLLNINLTNGYKLSYQIYGASDGYPVCYCHGFPASRLEARCAHEVASALGVCLISADRPGFGGSDFQPNRQMRSWVQTASDLMDALGHERFSVLGISGGGPYAMLMGEHLNHRIEKLAIVCGLGNLAEPGSEQEMDRIQQAFVRFARVYSKTALGFYQHVVGPFMRRFPKTTLDILIRRAPKVDRIELDKPETALIIIDAIREAFAQGGRGAAWELYILTHQWQANPAAIKSETLLWHGDNDAVVPVSMGRRHAELIPHCSAEFLPDDGHFSLPLNHMERILSKLIP